MSSELKELEEEMGTPFATTSGWLMNRIRELNEDKSNADKWREKQLIDFIEILQVSAHDLKRAHEEKKIATLAWITRNLLELSVWIEYCEKSDVNAKRFRDDAMRDMYGWATAVQKLYHQKSGKDNPSLKTSMDNLQKYAATKGIPALEDDFRRVSEAARVIGLGKRFVYLNKLYSKFAHPTAGLVHTVRAIEPDAEMRDMFFIDGATLAFKESSGHLRADQNVGSLDREMNTADHEGDNTTGGPLKPDFGLSGTVLQLDQALPLLFHAFVPSIPTRSLLVPHSQLLSGKNCSTPSPPDAHTSLPSRDCDECNAASPQIADDCGRLNRSTVFARNGQVPHSSLSLA